MNRIIAAQLLRQEIFETLLKIIFYSTEAPHPFVDPDLLRASLHRLQQDGFKNVMAHFPAGTRVA